ncbi:interference hedgehog-like [Pecten maximus]|uniref:interference hedgehog-like n=1 Tax=Pecten maximus TaxID=6579 RepID=UPI0014584430|nr:interference hedgehog-like [Pecten maximus]
MDSTYLTRLLLSVCFFGLIQLSEGGQLCGSCTRISNPSNCDHVTRCGDHEECMVSQYMTPGGHVMYDTGCIASFRCTHFGKRQSVDEVTLNARSNDGTLTLCQSCCNDTNICNTMQGLCNSQPLNTNGYILCYNCDQMTLPNQCDSIARCPLHQQCYVGQKVNLLSGTTLWESRCGHNAQECLGATPMIARPVPIVGKRLSPFCGTCCNSSNFCNDKCLDSVVAHTFPTRPPTSTSTTPATTTPSSTVTQSTLAMTPLSKPTITSLSPSREVSLGSSIFLYCAVTGNPSPKIAWGVTHFNAIGSKPNNTQILGNGHTMHIDHFIPANAGLYICYATNSQGTDSKALSVKQATSPATTASTTIGTTTSAQLSPPPMIIYSTTIHHARIGTHVRLYCVASGLPTPTISWSFLTSANPPDNLSLVGQELHINGFQHINYGTYRCEARNIHGMADKLFNISPF